MIIFFLNIKSLFKIKGSLLNLISTKIHRSKTDKYLIIFIINFNQIFQLLNDINLFFTMYLYYENLLCENCQLCIIYIFLILIINIICLN
jgi:hypothetical protein